MKKNANSVDSFHTPIGEPPIANFLFADTRSAPIWLVVRVWLGLQWLSGGWSHLRIWDFNNGVYVHNAGSGLKGFWDRAVAVAPGQTGALITYDWYYDFLKFMRDGGHYEWFAWLITFGEIAVGLGLIFGCLTAIAAFFGTVMNFSFELAGTTSTNPALFASAILVIMAWRTAGWWGLDRYVLPAIGTPWQKGALLSRNKSDDENRVPPTGSIPSA
jgi:thiosulfate dehydrogenase [quinone] large subunit